MNAERSTPNLPLFLSASFPVIEETAEIRDDTDTRSSKFNPDFWEVTLSDAGWRRFTTQDHPYFESDEDLDDRHARDEQARALRRELEAVIEMLTDRQREVVELYFFAEMNQRQIGEQLGISQQVVSEHLYGKQRDGKAVGGALRKLRKVCAVRGLAWPP